MQVTFANFDIGNEKKTDKTAVLVTHFNWTLYFLLDCACLRV